MASHETTLVLPSHFAPERELREQLSARAGRQRCLEGRDELLLMVHEVPAAGDSRRMPLVFWRRSDRCWLQAEGTGLGGMGELVERYAGIIARHQDTLETADSLDTIRGVLRHAGALARSTSNLLRALEQALAADPDDRDVRGYRDQAVDLERAAELLHHDARTALDCWLAERAAAQEQAAAKLGRTTFRLGLLAVGLLALIALSGLLMFVC